MQSAHLVFQNCMSQLSFVFSPLHSATVNRLAVIFSTVLCYFNDIKQKCRSTFYFSCAVPFNLTYRPLPFQYNNIDD